MTPPKTQDKMIAPALDRGIEVVEFLASAEGPVSFSEILASLKFPKASLVRILYTLSRRGIIEKIEEDGRYRLGMKMLYLGNSLREKTQLRSVAWPFMQKLARKLGETVELSIMDREQLVLIEQIDALKDVRVHSRVGRAYPYFHAVSAGKIYLAHMSPEARDQLLKRLGLPAITQWTITNLEDLNKEMAGILKKGYASENQEVLKGVRRVAAPIYDHQGEIAGCLSVAAPLPRFKRRDFSKFGRMVKRTGEEISKQLGGL